MKFHFLSSASFFLFLSLSSWAQEEYQQPVTTDTSAGRLYTTINPDLLQQSLDTLFARVNQSPGSSTPSWSTILSNGSNPGMDIDFNAYDITGLGGLTSTGTLEADSLTLNKDADITGRLSVTNVAAFGDSLSVSGYVTLGDSLEVVKAVMVGQTLQVTGITSLGDSLHVIGNVDFDALFHVDGAATFGSTLTVTGESILNDSLKVNSGANIAGTLMADSLSVMDVINGQVRSFGNHTTDDLAQGTTNLYMTSNERDLIAAMAHAIDSLSCTWLEYQDVMYELILIGDQCWFAENLRSTKYNNDAVIPSSLENDAWETTTDGAMTIYDEGGANEAKNLATYGRLYNWYAVNTGKLCPLGWHVPSDEEWTTLTDYLGGEGTAGSKMKSSASDTPAWNGTNSSGFSGLPGGWRYDDGAFDYVGDLGLWWSSSPDVSYAWFRELNSYNDSVDRSSDYQRVGFSVRCVRD